ncbi:DEKNAAC103405 [Brettanomyces naardenensis]|uniref:Cytochrome b-c1 complex subunit 7 n=1 Tax=Brettanomyces naardenensis TaxID=13370 RepID=A0A448YNI9_BRENA|nr:DEKNAAC103405 [Brettanomyces naardenensis]
MSTLTLVKKQAEFILNTPILRQIFLPASKVFVKYSGYRNMGLRQDDLLWEENPIVQKAISRLPAEESYARNFRILTAHQLSLSHDVLPDSKAVTPEEDTPFLTPYILEAEAEAREKDELDSIEVKKH